MAHIAKVLEAVKLEGDEAVGVDIVRRALDVPVKIIANNAGHEGSVVAEKVKELPMGQGFDAAKCEYVDMMAAGIVDPAKVTRSALQNAASIAAMILTTETLVTDYVEEKNEKCNCHTGKCGCGCH